MTDIPIAHAYWIDGRCTYAAVPDDIVSAVRQVTIEECAQIADAYHNEAIAKAIRALAVEDSGARSEGLWTHTARSPGTRNCR
jgi:hypothetical protein